MKKRSTAIPTLLCDFYKTSHRLMYPEGAEVLYSTLTPRSNKYAPHIDRVVVFGIQAFIQKYLIDYFNDNFFKKDEDEVVEQYLEFLNMTGTRLKSDNGEHIRALHKLGYLPLRIKAIPEGQTVAIRVPVMTIENTHKDFAWLTNYFETLINCSIWQPMVSASIARTYRKTLEKWAEKTCDDNSLVDFQAHDFSMRGMSSLETAETSGAGHLVFFKGTDTIPAISYVQNYYPTKSFIAGSIPACYDDRTEVLTDFGWKFFKDLKNTDKVAQYHKNGDIDFTIPTDYYNMPYTGKMIDFSWKTNLNYIDLSVTPNHRMIRKGLKGNLDVFEAGSKTSYSSKYNVIVSGNVKSEILTELSALDQFLIAFQADGSFFHEDNRYTGSKTKTFPVRFNLKKTRKIDRLTLILNTLGWEYKKTLVKSLSRKGYVDFYVKAPIEYRDKISKSFSDWIELNKVNHTWCYSFISELTNWDGNVQANTLIYASTHKANCDFAQIIGTLCGHKAKISSYLDKRGNRLESYTVSFSKRETVNGEGVVKSEKNYTGTVHCVSVPTGMLVVRRNNVVTISGNTEHSVMSAHGLDELPTFRYLMEKFPDTMLSIVSDTTDFWHNVSVNLPILKEEIMARPEGAKVVIRPDSGDPVDIVVGTTRLYAMDKIKAMIGNADCYVMTVDGVKRYKRQKFAQGVSEDWLDDDRTPEQKGLIECLWETFGGTINSKGYKVLHPCIGAIYGDSITYERMCHILEGLAAKGFATSNIVFGVGSFTYQYNTRDTLGFATKATSIIINGVEKPIFKDPKTDDGTKKSQRGRVKVIKNGSQVIDGLTALDDYSDDELELVFENGDLKKVHHFEQVRNRALHS